MGGGGAVALAHAGLVAATENISADGAAIDIDGGAANRIFSQVAAAEDIRVNGAALDVHLHCALGHTVEVVAAEHVATVLLRIRSGVGIYMAALDGDGDRTPDVGVDTLIFICC